jgi:hypothetical protein
MWLKMSIFFIGFPWRIEIDYCTSCAAVPFAMQAAFVTFYPVITAYFCILSGMLMIPVLTELAGSTCA